MRYKKEFMIIDFSQYLTEKFTPIIKLRKIIILRSFYLKKEISAKMS